MEQDHYKEYLASLEDTNIYPEALNNLEFRLKKRINKRHRQLALRGMGFLAVVILMFTIIVNTPTALADAILDLPLIGTLAEYVSFDKGLQNAVNNEYVQEVNLVQESNGYTLGLPYVIADSKRLVLFFQMPKCILDQDKEHYQLFIDNITDNIAPLNGPISIEHFNYNDFYGKEPQVEKNGLSVISIRNINDKIPQDLQLEVSLRKWNPEAVSNSPNNTDMSEAYPLDHYAVVGSYVFMLHLEDYAKPRIIPLRKELEIMSQKFSIDTITEYPTGMEIRISIYSNNTSLINGMEIIAYDAQGNVWNKPESHVISSSGDNNTFLYYLENNYFDSAPLDRLEITGVRMFKKSEGNITLDLANNTLTPQPFDLYIKSIEREGDLANITLETEEIETDTACLNYFAFCYKDLQENYNRFDTMSTNHDENHSQIYLTFDWPADNKVILTRLMSPMTKLKEPVKIDLTKFID